MNSNTIARKTVRIFLKIVLWGFLLFSCLFAVILLIGYHAASKPVSYLPIYPSGDSRPYQKGRDNLELKSSSYILFVNSNGCVIVKTTAGDTIMSDLTYYADYEGAKETWGLKNSDSKLTSDTTVLLTGEVSQGEDVSMLLTVHKNKPNLDVNIISHYNATTIVRRESLVARFKVAVSEVHMKNRKDDINPFAAEYWLQRQGVRFGEGDRSAMVYHTPSVSSLQLQTKGSLLFVNLEYYLDHPFINIPFQADGGARWVDLSTAMFKAGDVRSSNFSVYFGSIPKAIPRFMLVPYGYLAGYIFTEHADGGNIRTQRAAYFGSEEITRREDAKTGFAGHKIPVTKSVFYAGSSEVAGASIRDDSEWPELLDLLDQLEETGIYDICLHTPDGENSNRKILDESIHFMKNRFDSKTWIDHGMYSGKINRETSVADGLNPGSEFYSADLWEKYGTSYFWSPSVEVIRNYSLKEKIKRLKFSEVSFNLWKRYLSAGELNKISFFSAFKDMIIRYLDKGELNSLSSYKSSGFPTPLYWQHPTRMKSFYSWPTDFETETNDLSDKKVNTEKKLLNKLKSDWGVFFDHGYFVRNGANDNNLTVQNGKLVTNPYFDRILELMSQMRNDGDLYLTTVRELLDYWILTEKVTFEYKPGGIIIIRNGNDEAVKGLSLAIRAKIVRIDGEIPKVKHVGEDTIFWFDLPGKKEVTLQTE
jgi:hypothetical protein